MLHPRSLEPTFPAAQGLLGLSQTKRLELDLSGGSQTNLTGTADAMRVDASGGSRIEQELFRVNEADLRLSGGAEPKYPSAK